MMWTILSATGEVVYPCLFCDVHPSDPDSGWAWEDGQVAVEIDTPPDPARHSWSGTEWSVSVARSRELKWDKVKAYRESVRYCGCDTPKGRMQNDPDSQRLLNGAVSMSMLLGDSFAINWTMEDNSSVGHNAAEIQAAGIAMGMYDASCHAVGEMLRAAINAAATTSDVEAVDIEAVPWPT